jgi:hypothetical protein
LTYTGCHKYVPFGIRAYNRYLEPNELNPLRQRYAPSWVEVSVTTGILDAFKSGSRDSAAFWVEPGGKFIYIR